jgi:sugar lactone lactonase YvrE
MHDGQQVPYPDEAWNAWRDGADPTSKLVRVNSLRTGPDGDLWLVDTGSPAIGKPVLPGGAKLIRVNIATNTVSRTYSLAAAIQPTSFIDDVRFNGTHAYLTDAGQPGLLVLDLETGTARRILNGHPSVTADRPISAEGRIVREPDGKPVFVHADQLEVSPDGSTLYYQTCAGPLYRVPTRLLDDPAAAGSIADAVEIVADTPPTGGTAIAANGTIYLSDTDTQRILKIMPDGSSSTLIQDPRLLWVDAMWIDGSGRLWMPAAQLNRLAVFQGGTSKVRYPMQVYTIEIGARPSLNDHR